MSITEKKPVINAEPTKVFFVEMLTRDIPLEQALLDLVDNSVDAAKNLANNGNGSLVGREVKIEFSKEKIRLLDNCGGFSSEVAATYAFRFGKPAGTPRTMHSIGQFGVGMKRALFKFGHHFSVRSATSDDSWSVDIDVQNWESQEGWNFPWSNFHPDANVSNENPGTEIIVSNLRPEVANRFSTKLFQSTIIALIKSKHRQFIAGGLSISVNGQHLDATSLHLLVSENAKIKPGVDSFSFKEPGKDDVHVRIVVGVGPSLPREAGWYVVGNGRVILEADRRSNTGWGHLEEQSGSVVLPSFHNQFSRFRGIVTFDSNDSSRIPWNTTKTDVDQDNPIWQQTYTRMIELMRPVISFLNDLDSDIEEYTREQSPLLELVNKAAIVKAENLTSQSKFEAPARGTYTKKQRTIKIQYSKPVEQVDFLMHELSATSAKAVGERTFDLMYERMGGE